MFKAIILFILLIQPATSLAYDVIAVIDKDCRSKEGIVVNVNKEDLTIISLSGKTHIEKIKNIEMVLSYNMRFNPFGPFKVASSKGHLIKIFTKDNKDRPLFIGWPYRFVENLIFFISVDGKSYVLDDSQIYRIEKLGIKESAKFKPTKFTRTTLSISPYVPSCNINKKEKKNSIIPIKIMSDKIKISEYFNNLLTGYQNLENLYERTHLYAKPFIYEYRNRLSIPYFKDPQESGFFLPFAFQWGTGKDYHFQSENALGGQISKNLPTLEPVNLVRSDFKSHFFQGTFEGNMLGISAGNNVLDAGDIDNDQLNVMPSFNYITIMGGDYEKFSVGAGTFYPVTFIKFEKGSTREILGSKASLVFRLMYTTDRFNIRMLFSKTKYEFDQSNVNGQLRLLELEAYNYNYSYTPSITDFNYNNTFIRIGTMYSFSDDIKGYIDGVLYKGDYLEEIDGIRSNLTYSNTNISFGLEHNFSYYVNLKVNVIFYKRSYQGNFNGKVKARDDMNKSIGGVFELLF